MDSKRHFVYHFINHSKQIKINFLFLRIAFKSKSFHFRNENFFRFRKSVSYIQIYSEQKIIERLLHIQKISFEFIISKLILKFYEFFFLR